MAPIDNRDTVSRRGALTSGLACLLGLAGVGVLASDAAAQTVGMARRQDRRAMRHDRREDRRMVRQDRRLDRRTPDVVPATTGSIPAPTSPVPGAGY
jgi:transposase InsO family protein